MKIKTILSLFIFCLASVFTAHAVTVSDVRLATFNSGTARIVLETNQKAQATIFSLDNPDRLVIDLQNTTVSGPIKKRAYKGNSVISKVRFGTPTSSVSRIVLDLNTPVSESHFVLPPQKSANPWRLVLDLKPVPAGKKTSNTAKTQPKQTPPSTSGAKKAVAVAGASAPKESTSLLPFSSKKGKKIVMLDAGHGGQDPGAISKSGHYEKDLTLKMVKETKPLLEKAGYKVVLTRDGDYFVTLRGRVKKAHEANADLFISIHADSTKNTSAKGLSIYTISEKASDKEAAALAERENKADILLGMDLGDYQQEVSSVLIDLAKQETMKESRRYADLVVKEMRQTVQLVPNAHRFAGFAVLKSPNIPSVLLEMGYLSNVAEEKKLQSYAYRQKLSKALVRAINAYFKELGD